MKIYTEVNYKWLDGQLVKTDSKSFEYEGEITLCSFGGGGGGGGGDPITKVVNTAIESASNTADIVGQNVADAGDIAQESGGLTDAVTGGVSDTGEYIGSNLESFEGTPNIEGLGMNEGVSTTMGDFGAGINTNMAPIVAEADRWGDAATTNMKYMMGYVSDAQEQLAGITNDPAAVTIEKDKFAVDASKKKKNRSDLAVNKAKTRARKSLRIS